MCLRSVHDADSRLPLIPLPGSLPSIGEVGSAASVLSAGSWAGFGSLLPAGSRWSILPGAPAAAS